MPGSCAGWRAGKERESLTIYELGLEYAAAADLLRRRILELEQELELERDEMARQQLEGRIRPLQIMCRETMATAAQLQGYYLRAGLGGKKTRIRRRRG